MSQTRFIDVFAGCGGFSEGFLAHENGSRDFRLALAIDSDPAAHETHLLRAFYHELGSPPDDYYEYLRGQISKEELFGNHPQEAKSAAASVVEEELGSSLDNDQKIHSLIDERTRDNGEWVLIGGPPCQAFSIAGRSRNKGVVGYEAEKDSRHFLYREYLKILAEHWPAVFVMENVPGMLNSKVKIGDREIWRKILEDLVDPVTALRLDGLEPEYDGYRLYSLVSAYDEPDIFGVPKLKPDEYVVRCENYGIPQARHRVFILGVRSDLEAVPKLLKGFGRKVSVGNVIDDLPPLRSALSRAEDSDESWLHVMNEFCESSLWGKLNGAGENLANQLRDLEAPSRGRGGQFVPAARRSKAAIPRHLKSWLLDSRLKGTTNHESKAHMDSDIHRYAYAACFSGGSDKRLRLVDFPSELLPAHENVRGSSDSALSHSNFADRFAVQTKDEPARTIVSHISKDGHYYIHYDPKQARSLTVREAARLQTFPDNFFFPGPRTEQYKQVGNAVPPYLALQIADIVDDVLTRSGL